METGNQSIANGVLGTVDASSFPDGEITLHLVATAVDGRVSEHQVTCILDGTPPEVEILSPEAYGLLHEWEQVHIRVSDEQGVRYTCSMGRDDTQPSKRKVLLEGAENVDDLPANWNTVDFPAGAYRISVTAIDAAGNYTVESRIVSTGQVRYAGQFSIDFNAYGTPIMMRPDGQNLIVVTNRGMHTFSSTGTYLGPTLGAVSLSNLQDVLVAGNELICLFRYAPHIIIYNRQGQLLRSFGPDSPSWGYIRSDATLEVVDADNRILINNGGTIIGYSLSGSFLGTLKTDVLSMERDASGNIYTLRKSVTKVEVQDRSGQTIAYFGEWGPEPYRFIRLNDEAVDRTGHQMIVDNGEGGVAGAYYYKTLLSFWSPVGQFQGSTSGSGNAEGWFIMPLKAIWMSNGRIALLHLGRKNSSSTFLVSFFDPDKLFDGDELPMAAIDSPTSGSLVRPIFAVTGTAQGDAYELSVQGESNIVSVSSGQAAIVRGLLGVAHCESLQDGPVEIILRVASAEGTREVRRSVLLDSSGPVVSLDSPADYGSVTATTTIMGKATDANLTKWTLELGKPVSYQGYQWSTLAQGTSSIVGQLVIFNPAGYVNGVYKLRLWAEDAAGNSAQDEVVFSLGYVALTDIIKVLPDQAGYSNYSAMIAMLPDDSFLMVNSSGQLAHWAADGSYMGAFPWTPPVTGLQIMAMTSTQDGVLMLCGKGATFYVVDLAQDASVRHWFTIPLGDGQSMVRYCKTIIGAGDRVFIVEGNEIEVFTLDGVYVTTWGEFGRGDAGEFYGLVGGVKDQFDRLCFIDALGKLYFYSVDGQYRGQVDLKDAKGTTIYSARQIVVDPHGNFFVSTYAGFYIFRSDGTYLGTYPGVFGWIPGAFESNIAMAFDSRGYLWTYDKKSYSYDDLSCTFQVFDIDWDGLTPTIPSVAVYQPLNQGYVPVESWIQGKIIGSQSVAWSVEIGEGTSPNAWMPVADGSGGVEAGIIAKLDARSLPDGIYTLRLMASDGDGTQTEVRRIVTVDKTPPEVIIDQPVDRAVLHESASILGSITDAHPASYRLKYDGAESQYSVNQEWWTIASGSSYPAGGTLATWQSNFLTPDVFRLKTMAIDLANNLTVVNRDVSRHPLRFVRDISFTPFNYNGSLYYPFLASASRDGRVAATYQSAPNVSIYTENFEFIRDIAPVPDAGYASFQIAAVSFARNGELFVVGSNTGDGRTKLLKYSADGVLLRSYLIPASGTSSLGTWVDMQALGDGSVAFWGNNSSSSWWIKVYSPEQGLIRTLAAPAKASYYSISRMSVFAVDPEGNIVLPVSNASGVMILQVYSPEGTLLRTVNPPTGGWKSSYYTNLAVDGNGSFLLLSGLKMDKVLTGGRVPLVHRGHGPVSRP